MDSVTSVDIVIAGAGIAGLTTALGLHRLGIRSLVLESSDTLRSAGFAFITWTNAWKALDAVGVGDALRLEHDQLRGVITASAISGLPTSEMSFMTKGTIGDNEVRCMKRKLLLEALEKDLPDGTIRFSSKVVSIEDSGYFKLVHLADGTVLKTKVLIGCDGVNSVVAKHLGLHKAAFAGRSGIRGCVNFKDGHGFEPKVLQFFGKGVRSGFIPCDDTTVYWFLTFSPSIHDKEVEVNPAKMKEFVLSKLGKVPSQVRAVVELTQLDNIMCSPLRFRHPWGLLTGNFSKGNTCVAGDALHPMTPDVGQGGCAALEDGVILARCLGEAFLKKYEGVEMDEYKRIEMGLKKFAKERAWRSFELISTSYVVGFFQQSNGVVLNFLRDKVLASFLAGVLLKRASFDCGKLTAS